ncbi:GNAT family N-acetyltransferase [Planococcus salinus]|uniref:GNAT family N-acetyltransferase n=1 Tax=Planococcus salinus TaxID=1848460 RepID=A0A3M8P6H7_9BACL|nr:GNAT family N-acetyltransferase [Planococcus salinus]RNF39001.1 GNAT family N-acetyltransferase [Planococcus salinus]
MEKQLRQLTVQDFGHVEAMETGITDDYVKRVFPRISSGHNRLYGLFLDGQLVSMGGYSIFADCYAMLGRMRSDRRFRGKDLSTQLMTYIIDEVFKLPNIQWVGANTQRENAPARRVLDKLGLTPNATLVGATAQDVSMLEAGGHCWKEINSVAQKKHWINEAYVKTGKVFPYECYYPFPASAALFPDDQLTQWTFYENEAKSRFLVTKKDIKKNTYLHVIYPWDDLAQQEGLWETVTFAHRKLQEGIEETSYIWMDLHEQAVSSLPDSHPFDLPSPWILYGTDKSRYEHDFASEIIRVTNQSTS